MAEKKKGYFWAPLVIVIIVLALLPFRGFLVDDMSAVKAAEKAGLEKVEVTESYRVFSSFRSNCPISSAAFVVEGDLFGQAIKADVCCNVKSGCQVVMR